ncbi:MAG TPA: glycosyl hydrolase family 28-related protein [Candidatus Rubrimentiphilum sp.]|nr:glycosyl hydrolase family 28-related protein [Candidatus Rubrimentiphilum sp.]
MVSLSNHRRAWRGALFALFIALTTLPASAQTAPALFNVQLYGAKGDGIADDTQAFAAARDAAAAAGGGVIYAPHVHAFYRVSGCPALNFASTVPLTLRGDGRFLTIIQTSSPACDIVSVNQSRFTIESLSLDCVTQCTAGQALAFRSGSFVRAYDLWFGFQTFGDIAIGAPELARASSDKVTIESIDGHIAHAGGAGIDVETGYSDIELRDVRLNCNEPARRAGNAYGLRARGSFDTLTMSGVYLQDCGYGMAFTPADGAIAEDIIGTNIILDGMEQTALLMRPQGVRASGMVLRVTLDNLWAGAQGAPGGTSAVGILLDGGPRRTGVDGVRISNFTVPLAQTYGIALDRGNDPAFPMHAAFTGGSVSAWSHAAPGKYPAVAVGLTSPVDDVLFSGVATGAWAHVGTPESAARAYRIHPGSKHVRVEGP